MLKKAGIEFIIPVGISSIASSVLGANNANNDFYKKYNTSELPVKKQLEFYEKLSKGMGIKKDIAWGAGRIMAQGAGIVAGSGIANEVMNDYYPEYKEYTPEVVAAGAALGVAPMSYISSKMYTKALGENAANKSGIKPDTGVDNVKQSSWKEGYTKEELEKIAGPLGYTVGSVAFSPLAAGLGVPTAIGVNKGINEAITNSRPSKEEEQIMKSDPGFWTGTKAGITSLVPTLAGSLAGYGIEKAISDDSSGMYGAFAGAAAAGIPSSYYLGKYFGKDDALTARAKTYSTVKQSSWKEGYTKEELEKIAACAKQEKDAANVFDLNNSNNNITSSKYRTIEQSQNISKILPKFQRKGGVIPATLTPKPVPTNLARRA